MMNWADTRRSYHSQPCHCDACLDYIDEQLDARVKAAAFAIVRPRYYPFFTLPSHFRATNKKATRRLTRPLGGVPTVTMPTDVTEASGK